MQNARVIGTARATVKHPSMEGWKLLVVETLGPDGQPDGEPPILAVDPLGAGYGDVVVVSSDGDYARGLLGCETSPVRWSVLGIVDPR